VKKLLPNKIEYMGDEIIVTWKNLDREEATGMWADSFMHILLDPNQPDIEKIDTIIHELMHYMETKMINDGARKRGISHDYITNAATCLSIMLGKYGLLKNVSESEAVKYERELTVKRWTFRGIG
jgi:hypothetical protein